MSTTTAAALTRPRGVAVYLSALLGAGLLAMPTVTYQAAGPASLVAWGALLVLSVPVALTFARLGATESDASGVGGYVTRAFGARAGDVVSFWFVLAVPFGAPATALVGTAYVTRSLALPDWSTPWVAAVLLGAASLAARAGLRLSGLVQIGLTVVLLVVLTVACVGALPQATTSNLHPFSAHGLTGIGSAMGVLFFSFAGWEAVAPITHEFAHPARDVMRVTWWTLLLVTVLYLSLSVMSVLALGPELGRTDTPVQALLAHSVGGVAAPVTGVLAAVLTFGAMTAYVSGAGRMAAALARDGRLPGVLAAGVERGDTPRNAVTAVAGASFGVLAVTSLAGVPLAVTMAMASATISAVTGAGLVAGSKLLPGRSARAQAGTAGAVMVVVLAGCGWGALYPVLVAVVAWAAGRGAGS